MTDTRGYAVVPGLLAAGRLELAQTSWFARHLRDPRFRRQTSAARAGLTLPALPRQPRRPGEIWAVSMVKDEADVIEASIDHLLGQGVHHVLVADNLSSDGTLEILERLAKNDPRIHVARDREPAYYQSEKMTLLARAAARAGADWIVPFDADEFWFARGQTLQQFFAELTGRRPMVGLVLARFHHMVPTEAHPARLREASFVIDASPARPGKAAFRAHRLAVVAFGNHGAARVGTREHGLHIAHAIYRGPAQIERKVRNGVAAVRLTDPAANIAPHWRMAEALDAAAIQDVWATISAGQPDDRIGFRAYGPMVTATPLTWPTWDPEDALPWREPRNFS